MHLAPPVSGCPESSRCLLFCHTAVLGVAGRPFLAEQQSRPSWARPSRWDRPVRHRARRRSTRSTSNSSPACAPPSMCTKLVSAICSHRRRHPSLVHCLMALAFHQDRALDHLLPSCALTHAAPCAAGSLWLGRAQSRDPVGGAADMSERDLVSVGW